MHIKKKAMVNTETCLDSLYGDGDAFLLINCYRQSLCLNANAEYHVESLSKESPVYDGGVCAV